MIRRGLALLLVTLALTSCSILEPPVQPRIGTLQLDIQNRPQQEEDILSEDELAGVGVSFTADSTRYLGSDDGRDFYVGSSETDTCLIEVTDNVSNFACGSSLPISLGDDGGYRAELWWDKDARQGSPVGFWIGDYLWMQS